MVRFKVKRWHYASSLAFVGMQACPSWALEPTFSLDGLSAMQTLAQASGSVAMLGLTSTLAGAEPKEFCSGTMLTASLMLTASHCFAFSQPGDLPFGIVNGLMVERVPASRSETYYVAQGRQNLFHLDSNDFYRGPGLGFTAYGTVEAVIRSNFSIGPDLALALVRPIDPFLTTGSFNATTAKLPVAGQQYEKIVNSQVGNKIVATVVGHKYGPPGSMTGLGSITYVAPAIEWIASQPPSGGQVAYGAAWYYREGLADLREIHNGPPTAEKSLLHLMNATVVKGDSGGAMYARNAANPNESVLIGVTKGNNPEFAFYTAVEPYRDDFLDKGIEVLSEMSKARYGKGPSNPIFADASSSNGVGIRVNEYVVPYSVGVNWVAASGTEVALSTLEIGGGFIFAGLDLGDAALETLRVEGFSEEDQTFHELAYEADGFGGVYFLDFASKLRISGSQSPDGLGGTTAIGFIAILAPEEPPVGVLAVLSTAGGSDAGPGLLAADETLMNITWTTTSPVPEPGAASMLLVGIAFLLRSAGRRLQGRRISNGS